MSIGVGSIIVLTLPGGPEAIVLVLVCLYAFLLGRLVDYSEKEMEAKEEKLK